MPSRLYRSAPIQQRPRTEHHPTDSLIIYSNEDARMRWLYPANIGTAIINGRLTTVLIDSGARMNVVTPEFVKARGLAVGSIQDLNNHAGRITINGVGGKRTEPLGYVMIRVQIPYAQVTMKIK